MKAIGLMSGTSMDGVDAALIETDGLTVQAFGPSITLPYDEDFRSQLRGIMGGKGPVAEVEAELTRRHAQAVRILLAEAGAGGADIVGFHGQTILHQPEAGKTWQIGDGGMLARLTGIDVVADFRSDDVAAGGQGAPLAPLYHAALAQKLPKPLAVLNLGGVGNVTWIGAADDLLAFDTGPGNALLDDWALAHTGQPVDQDGRLAKAGTPSLEAVEEFSAHAYFDCAPPKSLDRDMFKHVAEALLKGASPENGAATLAAFTARSAGLAARHFPAPVKGWLICGGGRRNPVLMEALARELLPLPLPVESVGWDGDALEAQAFAYLAVRSLKGLPLSVPGTTAVPLPQTGGKLFKA